MKALGKLKSEPGLWLYDAPMPTCGPNDLLVRVSKTALCGTDLHIYEWDDWAQQTIPVPMTVGHEFVGIIEEVGSEVKQFKVGDRVAAEGHITCGYCRNCRAGKRHLCRNTLGIGVHRTGCFAEYISFPAGNAFLVPDDIPDDIAGIFDPLGNAVHAALSFDLIGEDVLITGAGPIGLMAACIARHVGARHVVVTDVNRYRLSLAEELGVTRAVHATEDNLQQIMKELGMSEGFDVGLEMSGSPVALSSMVDVMNHGGKMVLLGILPDKAGIDWTKVIFNSLYIKGIYGREMFETWYKMITMLQTGLDISKVITHTYSALDFESAFEAMRSKRAAKVVLDWAPIHSSLDSSKEKVLVSN